MSTLKGNPLALVCYSRLLLLVVLQAARLSGFPRLLPRLPHLPHLGRYCATINPRLGQGIDHRALLDTHPPTISSPHPSLSTNQLRLKHSIVNSSTLRHHLDNVDTRLDLDVYSVADTR